MIAVEFQFWPGASWEKGEIGLGQMTAMGADLLLSLATSLFPVDLPAGFGRASLRQRIPGLR